MLTYIIRRLLLLIPILIGVSIAVFLMIHLIPGDPAKIMLGERATADDVARLREQMGLNDPLYQQYLRFMKDLLKGDLGRSVFSNEKITTELFERYPATIELTIASMLVAVLVGVPVGIISATKKYSIIDYLTMTGALVGVSMPIFWLGLMVIWLFAFKLGWFPPSARLSVGVDLHNITNFYVLDSILTGNWIALKDSLYHLILPSFSLATIPMAIIARMTRSSMLEVLSKDYIKTAYAKGLSQKVVIYKHALRNALIPIVTVIGLQFGLLLGGAVLTETIFSWPGVGKYSVTAILSRDFPAVQGSVLALSTTFVLVNLMVDLLYGIIDPKIHYN
ncbi:peptide/nickel transport system permease protein [Orenia metallireducens]|jgi:peptide/nickel transport system permease protein|uniref:Peptide/nickel transport system permease protein n=1 Tax=Orenia metallireducens TaxID=1413210 RepID=A0A285GSY0_9FIRM|nr:ABC transporter permease [Orenia metallireducens]PRX16655.1 peptide/nickel transport system permease protein [Orenia metallireducens]SNY26750.1 peptide/nickel transport system permease protein [Orenia metallireducens]